MIITPVTVASRQGEEIVSALLNRFQAADNSCRDDVRDILRAVREKKDEALLGYCRKFDAPGLTVEQLMVNAE